MVQNWLNVLRLLRTDHGLSHFSDYLFDQFEQFTIVPLEINFFLSFSWLVIQNLIRVLQDKVS